MRVLLSFCHDTVGAYVFCHDTLLRDSALSLTGGGGVLFRDSLRFVPIDTLRGGLATDSLRWSALRRPCRGLLTYTQVLFGRLRSGWDWAATGSGWGLDSAWKSSKWPGNRQKQVSLYFFLAEVCQVHRESWSVDDPVAD